MTETLPIAITVLRCGSGFVFLRRRNPPYEHLWSLVGGKVNVGEHIRSAAIREVMEETGADTVRDYTLRGVVSERLLDHDGSLLAHFLIFVGHAEIDSFVPSGREGELALFTPAEVEARRDEFLPSDLEMFRTMSTPGSGTVLYEAELVRLDRYVLRYYRMAGN